MRAIKQNYLHILNLEIKDLEEDTEELISACKKRMEAHDSENVAMLNLSLFRNELLGLSDFRRILTEINPDDFETLADMIMHIRKTVQKEIQIHHLAEAIWDCVERKIRKVTKYVTNCKDFVDHELKPTA